MTILVTGSAGHLGEALMRTVAGAEARRAASTSSRRRSPTWSARSPTATLVRAAMEGVRAVLHTATLHKPHIVTHTPPAVRRHQRQRHADVAGSGRRRRGRGVRPDQHHERVRRRAAPRAGRAGGVDRRGRRAAAEEHLRRDQARRRAPVPGDRAQPRAAGRGAAHLALLPRGDRRRRGAARICDRQPAGARTALSSGRHRRHGERAPRGGGARRRDRLRHLHRLGDHAVLARRPCRAAHATPAR